MNGTYYQNPTFPTNQNNYDVNMNHANNQGMINNPNSTNTPNPINNFNQDYNMGTSLPMEQSYIENILRLNKGKMVKAYVSFPDSTEWRNKIFAGRIEEAGRDHLIISNPNTGEWDLILMIYLNYVTFDERINYSHSYSEKNF
ncbi:MAG: spore coat protein GerQ [Bacilli bacterium]|nr:spore coat protein GerQ [Bacilli bacterium]